MVYDAAACCDWFAVRWFGLEFVIDAACWVCCLVWFWWVWAVDNGCFGFVTVLRWFVCCECGFVVIY